MNDEELLAKYKALFPDNVEAIVVRKDDYDRLYGDLTIENIELKQEIERLHSIIKEVREKVENYDVFKEFTFPLMKRDQEHQVKSSIEYEWREFIKKPILEILDKVKEI